MNVNAASTTKPMSSEIATTTRNNRAQPGSHAFANGVTNPTMPSALAAITTISAMSATATMSAGTRPRSMRAGRRFHHEKPRNSVATPEKNSLATPAARVVVWPAACRVVRGVVRGVVRAMPTR